MVRKTKFSIAFAGEKRKTMAVLKYFLCISSIYNLVNSRVPKNRQTENLGDFDGFQPSRMPTFQILRFAEIEINPCNPSSNTGTKKPNGVSPYGIKTKKMVEDFYANQNSIRIFCNSLIVKDSHKDTRILFKK